MSNQKLSFFFIFVAVDDCAPNSHWWPPLAMHPVLTLGKRREIARLEWERGARVERHRHHICPCVLKSPHGPLLRPARPSSISRFNYQRLAGPLFSRDWTSFRCHWSSSCETVRSASTYILFDNTELLFNMSSEPRLLLPLCRSAQHMIRWTPVCFVTTNHLLSDQKNSWNKYCLNFKARGHTRTGLIHQNWHHVTRNWKPKVDNIRNKLMPFSHCGIFPQSNPVLGSLRF